MTTKERWTVYPLLLLAIGLALRGTSGPPGQGAGLSTAGVTTDTIVCKELAIVGETGSIIVHAGRVKDGGGGRIEIRDAAGKDAIGLGTSVDSRDGSVEFFDTQGKLLGRLGPLPEPPTKASPAAGD